MSLKNALTWNMQRLLDEVESTYRETGFFTPVSIGNQTAHALARRDKVVIVKRDGNTMYLRPLEADGTAPFKRSYRRLVSRNRK